ncbi:MAG: LysR family transcriptional regulator [Pseudomonadota bacterium]
MAEFDWNDLKALLAAADAGSLSAAAEAVGASQPTLGRRLDALEATLGLKLFDRGPRGLTLTAPGRDMLAHAREVQAAAARLSLAAAGRGEALEGTVRLTAPEVVSAYHLPEILGDLAEEEPNIEIELVASDQTENLLLREADIAIRMYRPQQANLIARKIGDFPLGLYASEKYIARNGEPSLKMADGHRLIGFDRNPLMAIVLAEHGFTPPPKMMQIRTDHQIVYWRLVLAGVGIGANQTIIGDRAPTLRRVLPEFRLDPLPMWLACHEELRTSALIRRVFDHLAERLARLRSAE